MILPQFYTDDIIKRAILEDINYVDVASDYLISEEQRNEAYFVSKADGVLCGIDVAMRVFELLDDSFTAKGDMLCPLISVCIYLTAADFDVKPNCANRLKKL